MTNFVRTYHIEKQSNCQKYVCQLNHKGFKMKFVKWMIDICLFSKIVRLHVSNMITEK